MPGFIPPYRGVRYHLNEHRGRPINNKRELFNLRHSSLRSKIESTFGLLKNRFKILTAKPHYPFPTQVDIVLACYILHNHIATVDPGDDLLNEDIHIEDDDGEIDDEGDDQNVVDFTQNMTQREERDSRNEWKEKRDEIASAMWFWLDLILALYDFGVTGALFFTIWLILVMLAKLARDGLKVDKNFKMHAYKVAADEVNKQCGTEFTKENVMNHMKSLKSKFFDMRTVMNMSGAGYDPTTKIVIMDPESFDMWTKDNKYSSAKLKDYLNTPLTHYDDLCVIVGDDQARGNLSKDMCKKLGSSRPLEFSEQFVNLDENDNDEGPTSHFEPVIPSGEQTYTQAQNVKSSSGVTSTSNVKTQSKKKSGDSLTRDLIESMSYSIQNQHILHWSESMAKALLAHEPNFSETILDKALDFLYDNESESRRFIIKSKNAQKLFIEKIIRENGFDKEDWPKCELVSFHLLH
ncbi:uncharacterized protein LOC109841808 [Asparagus officinalis]|uniref:uncharacterized protein LOC109841808 n=1 Tax=Asparagus officinalis TaxID=4686 RepID=UPI00098DE8D7|nr:uncharacterized protein LOC109841808 [Asparagus officinalis]